MICPDCQSERTYKVTDGGKGWMCVDCGLLFADDTKKREPDEVTILQSDLTLNIKRMTDLVGANETYEFVSALLKQPDHLETTIKEPNQWGDD